MGSIQRGVEYNMVTNYGNPCSEYRSSIIVYSQSQRLQQMQSHRTTDAFGIIRFNIMLFTVILVPNPQLLGQKRRRIMEAKKLELLLLVCHFL